MESWKVSCLKFFSILLLGLASCSNNNWYKKEFTPDEKVTLAKSLLGGVGFYYQGTVPQQFLMEEALSFDSTNADIWREFGTAPVKRGLAVNMQYFYGQAVKYNPKEWQGWRGYLYLYFYRDFKRAIKDFNTVDSLLGLVDNSQGQNHDYMRGIANYGLGNYDDALLNLNKYINTEIATNGEDWVDVYAILYRAYTFRKLNKPSSALEDISMLLRLYPNLADAHFLKAEILYSQNYFDDALKATQLAKKNFLLGYYHKRPYIEVIEQIYLFDIVDLEIKIQLREVFP